MRRQFGSSYRISGTTILRPSFHQTPTSRSLESCQTLKYQSTSPKMPQAQPELKKVSVLFKLRCAFCPGNPADNALFLQYMEKRVFCQLNGNRKVIGILRGYDVRRI